MKDRGRIYAVLVALIAAGFGGFVVELADDDKDGRPDRVIVRGIPTNQIPAPSTVAVDGPDRDVEPDRALKLDREAREVYQRVTTTPERFDLGGGLRGDDDTPVAQHEGPLATPHFPGCETRMLQTNWSNRTVPISQVDGIGLHYTAGANREGKSDMNGLTAYANSPSARVSWHFLIDAEGHCYYSVPLGKRAWTIGNANNRTVNIEVIGTGREPRYPAGSPGARKLAQVVRKLGRVLNVPMRVGAFSNCDIARSGIMTHWQGGQCSGGHVDIKPYNINTVVAQIRDSGCDRKCRRTRDLRTRHAATHRRIRRLECRTEEGRKAHPASCAKMYRRNTAIHNAARRERIRL